MTNESLARSLLLSRRPHHTGININEVQGSLHKNVPPPYYHSSGWVMRRLTRNSLYYYLYHPSSSSSSTSYCRIFILHGERPSLPLSLSRAAFILFSLVSAGNRHRPCSCHNYPPRVRIRWYLSSVCQIQ